MSTEANKSLVHRYIEEVWDKQNPAAVDEFLAPTYKRYLSPTATPLTREGQRQRLTGFRAAFPDVHLTIEDMFAEGDRITFRSTMRGTHQGVFQGIAPAGKHVTVSLIDIVRVENGQIVEHWGGPDLFDLLQQLGAVVSVGSERKQSQLRRKRMPREMIISRCLKRASGGHSIMSERRTCSCTAPV